MSRRLVWLLLAVVGCGGGPVPPSHPAGIPPAPTERSVPRGAGPLEHPIVFRAATGWWYYLKQFTAQGAVADDQFLYGGDPSDMPVTGDFDANGRRDVGVFRRSSGVWYLLTAWDASGPQADMKLTYGGDPSDIPLVGDWDGDGRDDPGVYRAATQGFFLLTAWTAAGSLDDLKIRLTGGAPEDLPVAGDFDGDGKDDLAVFHPGTGRWLLDTTRDGLPEHTFVYGGDPTDMPVAGDFDADGREDVGVYRRATGQWFMLTGRDGDSVTGDAQVTYGGHPTDLPVPGDYNGDGQADPGIYRRSTGRWFMMTGRNGSQPTADLQIRYGGHPSDLPPATSAFYEVVTRPAREPRWDANPSLAGGRTFAHVVSALASELADFDGDGRLDLLAVGGRTSVHRSLPDGTFVEWATVLVGGTPRDGLAGDFTGDGRLDVALARDSLEVYPGLPGGGFGPPLVTAQPLSALEKGDFDEDGRLDLVGKSSSTSRLVLLRGDGSGGFSATTYVSTFGPLLAGDLTGDGHLDAAVLTGGKVQLFRGLGNGTFAPVVEYPVASDNPKVFQAADLEPDGDLDLLVASLNATAVLVNQGGVYAAGAPVASGSETGLAVGDLDRDGLPDLVTPFRFLRGRGDGTFRTGVPFGGSLSLPHVLDADGDRVPDLVGLNGGLVSTWLGRGDGTILTPGRVGNAGHPLRVAGDWTGDGRADVLGVAEADGTMAVLPGDGSGGFLAARTTPVAATPWTAFAAQVDGDGVLDAVLIHKGNRVTVQLGRGDGTFTEGDRLDFASSVQDVAVGDLDGDGDSDLVACERYGNRIDAFLGAGDGTFGEAVVTSVTEGPRGVEVGDFDGDGRLDVVMAQVDRGRVSVLLGNGNGTFAAPLATTVGDWPTDVAVRDLDGDGNLDAVATCYFGDDVWVLRGEGDGRLTAASTLAGGDGPVWPFLRDLDGDGVADLVHVEEGSGSLCYRKGGGALAFGPPLRYRAVPSFYADLADFDGDGRLDVLLDGQTATTTLMLQR